MKCFLKRWAFRLQEIGVNVQSWLSLLSKLSNYPVFHFLVEHSIIQLNGTGDEEGRMSRYSPWENCSCLICHLKKFWQFLAEQSHFSQHKQHENKQQHQHFFFPLWAVWLVLWSHTCLFNKDCSSIKSLYIMESFIITREPVCVFSVCVWVGGGWSPTFGSGSINKSLREELLSTCLPFVLSSR